MKNSAASQHNKLLAETIRSRATKLDDTELRAKANHLAQIIEKAETEAPASVLDLIFRKPPQPKSIADWSSKRSLASSWKSMARPLRKIVREHLFEESLSALFADASEPKSSLDRRRTPPNQ